MHCPSCGAERPGTDVPCPACGAVATSDSTDAESATDTPATEAAATDAAATEAAATDAAATGAAATDAAATDAAAADASPSEATPQDPSPPVVPPPSGGSHPAQPPPPDDSSSGRDDSPGASPPVPPAPPDASGVAGGSGGRPRTWVLVALGVGVLAVIGAGALAVVLLVGSDPDDAAALATEQATVAAPADDAVPPGTDADLDDLYLACADGDMAACDDLFARSAVGSDYEAFGRTCGDRVDDAGSCVNAFEGDADGAADGAADGLPDDGPDAAPPGSDSAMDTLWVACAAEDWQACDDLYFESEFGSVYEEFGRTCGYRIEDAFLCTQDMSDREAAEDGFGAGGMPGSGPDAAATVAPATDEELDVLWNACQDEDWAACDLLFFESEANSDYEFFAATCGARDLLAGGGQLCQVLHADPDKPPVVLPTDLVAGICFDEPEEDEVVYWIQTVPCKRAHDVEIMGVATLPDGPMPDDMATAAVDVCLPIFEDFVGTDYISSGLDIYHLSPTPESWDLGDNEVACGIYDPDGPTKGSLEGSKR